MNKLSINYSKKKIPDSSTWRKVSGVPAGRQRRALWNSNYHIMGGERCSLAVGFLHNLAINLITYNLPNVGKCNVKPNFLDFSPLYGY
jgi:hypothetical protein